MVGKRGSKVLVVDDDVDICLNVRDILSDLGYVADVAHDGHQALELLRRNAYQVALIDFRMPDMDGATLYGELKKIRPEVVAIMVTAYASEDGVDRAQQLGTWKVLRKPVDILQLLELVEQAVSEPLVCVVDDDSEFCDTLWHALRERGYRVAVAHDERSGIQTAQRGDIQAAIVDLRLKEGTGAKVLKAIHDANPQARSILITGHRTEVDELEKVLPEPWLDAVCYKPLDIPQLLQTLAKLTQVSVGPNQS